MKISVYEAMGSIVQKTMYLQVIGYQSPMGTFDSTIHDTIMLKGNDNTFVSISDGKLYQSDICVANPM